MAIDITSIVFEKRIYQKLIWLYRLLSRRISDLENKDRNKCIEKTQQSKLKDENVFIMFVI